MMRLLFVFVLLALPSLSQAQGTDGGAASPGAGADAGAEAPPAPSEPSGDAGVGAQPAPPIAESDVALDGDAGAFDPFAGLEPLPPPVDAGATAEIAPEDDLFRVEAVNVVGSLDPDARRAPGAVYVLDEKRLEVFEQDDAHQVLTQVPGVYVRQEDGYGLRPNIGMRGADSDRSKKVTLMEDGLLFGPAPYSAPAAYYFPLMTRMVSVEAFKGATSLRYGPQTIGGGLDLRTRQVPDAGKALGIDGSYGNTDYAKLHSYAGYGTARWGLLAEGVHLSSSGFKELDGGGDTGFSKQELMLKGRVNTDPNARVYQRLEVKGGFSHEDSNETYLGLTDQDFRKNPLRRYRASQRDVMGWWRTQAELFHVLGVGDHFELRSALYRHDLSRLWKRVDGLISLAGPAPGVGNAPRLSDVLASPDSANSPYYEVLTGAGDSMSAQAAILQAGNRRTFVSQGIQTVGRYDFTTGKLEHVIELGLRLHQDSIARRHTARRFDMEPDADGELNLGPAQVLPPTADNEVRTLAFAAHLAYELTYARLTLTPTLRTEIIRAVYEERLDAQSEHRSDTKVALLGLGALYALTDELSLLAGVQQGMTPVAPDPRNDSGDPERAVNYEAGLRYSHASGQLSAIGFLSDYEKVIAPCDDGTCPGGAAETYSSGRALVYGAELGLDSTVRLPRAVSLPLRAAYTYTHTEFLEAFNTNYLPWGGGDSAVEAGDELPYIPPHQWSLGSGFAYRDRVGVDFQVTFVDRTREEAGQGELETGKYTDRYALLDASAFYCILDSLRVYVKGDNLTNNQPIVARRPFGARPNKPLLVQVGFKWQM